MLLRLDPGTYRNVVPTADSTDLHFAGVVLELDEDDALALLGGLVRAFPYAARDAVARQGRYAREVAS